jgi:hypothetical protein
VPTLSLVDIMLTESQKWDLDTLINRQILMDEGPWRSTDMTIVWELYCLIDFVSERTIKDHHHQCKGLLLELDVSKLAVHPSNHTSSWPRQIGMGSNVNPEDNLRVSATTVGSMRTFATVETKSPT